MKPLTNKFLIVTTLLCFCNILFSQITYQSAFPNLNFEFPVEIQCIDNETEQMFVVEQRGRIKVFPKTATATSSQVKTFLDITDRVQFSNGQELGLLGLAFHPDYKNNKYFYVYYTTNSPVSGISTRMVLSRFSAQANDPTLADPNSELVIFQFDKNQNNSNHNGGKIAFGSDSYLYISFGDGGGGNDPQRNGQNKNTVFGSICRIDVDIDDSNPIETNPALPNNNYEIPSDNPFVGVDGLDEIYAYGIRNTWKFSFDAVSGKLWGADVGQNAFEEINNIEKGKNYGWSRFEGNSVANSNVVISGPVASPVFNYNHNQGDVSITGGYVYRGSEITSLNPDINSKYIFADYVSGRVWALNYNPSTGDADSTLLFKTDGLFVSSFGVDTLGELYFSSYGTNGKIYQLVDGTTSPTGTQVNGIGSWGALNEGIDGIVHAIATDTNGNVYHGGVFNKAGTVNAKNIAVWNQNSGWSALGGEINGSINALKTDTNGNLYAGGSFTKIGGINANHIAVWNGTQWSALGSGVDGAVAAIEIHNNTVFVGGVFKTAGGTEVRNIAQWNSNQWSALTDSTNQQSGTNNEIRSLAIGNDGILYAGGNFDEAGGNTANRIATWNGSNWGTLGIGTSGFVEAITTTPSSVFIGGNFALAGGTTVNRIAKWDIQSKSWSKLGNGVNNIVRTLLHDGTHLYAAGAFDIASNNTSNDIVNNIAQWSENGGWKAMGTNTSVGVDIIVNAMTFSLDDTQKIIATGNFSKAGAITAHNTAIWTNSTDTSCTAVIPSDITSSDIKTTSVQLSWKIVTSATYDVRYRETTTNDWVTISTAENIYSIENLKPNTSYEAQIRSKCPDNTVSNYSNSTLFTTLNEQINYCESNGNDTSYEYIGNVTIGTINKTSMAGTNGYSDFTSESTELSKGISNNISITPIWPRTTTYNEIYTVWIDYNQDGDFADPGEQVWNTSTRATPVNGNFTIPDNAQNGPTRMRVALQYNGTPGPCASFRYGEVEDYNVIINATSKTDQKPGSKTLNFNIFPNPTNDFILIKTNLLTDTVYYIQNQIGQVVKKGKITTEEIHLNDLSSGLYLITVASGNKSKTKKLILK